LSHDATARYSAAGENERSEMPSSGGATRVKSFEMSPLLLFPEAAVVEALEPKRPDILPTAIERKDCLRQRRGILFWPYDERQ